MKRATIAYASSGLELSGSLADPSSRVAARSHVQAVPLSVQKPAGLHRRRVGSAALVVVSQKLAFRMNRHFRNECRRIQHADNDDFASLFSNLFT